MDKDVAEYKIVRVICEWRERSSAANAWVKNLADESSASGWGGKLEPPAVESVQLPPSARNPAIEERRWRKRVEDVRKTDPVVAAFVRLTLLDADPILRGDVSTTTKTGRRGRPRKDALSRLRAAMEARWESCFGARDPEDQLAAEAVNAVWGIVRTYCGERDVKNRRDGARAALAAVTPSDAHIESFLSPEERAALRE